jgi:uncharacterized membrane protein
MKATLPLGVKAREWAMTEKPSKPFNRTVFMRYITCIAAIIVSTFLLSSSATARDVDLLELKAKGDRAVELVKERASKGKDVANFVVILEEIRRLGETRQFHKADKLADKALFLLDVAEKADRAVALVQERAADGQDVSEFLPMLKRIKELGDSHRFHRADKLLDKTLYLLQE